MAVGLAGHLDIEITFGEREKRSHGADFAYLGHRVSGEQAAGVDPAHRTQIGERGEVAGIDTLPVGGTSPAKKYAGSTSRGPITAVPSRDRVHPASATRTARSAITRLTHPIFHRRADHGGKTSGFGLTAGLATVFACSGCSFSAAATGSDPDRLPVAGVRDAPVESRLELPERSP